MFREDVWGGWVTVNGIESMTASSHSSVAPKHTASSFLFFFATAGNKAKVKVAEPTAVHQLSLFSMQSTSVDTITVESLQYSASVWKKKKKLWQQGTLHGGGDAAGIRALSGTTRRLCTYIAVSSVNVKTLSLD